MSTLFGLRIVESPFAYRIDVWHEVRPMPIPKRRRGYRVVRCEKRVPCAIKTDDGTLFVPPEFMAQMPHQLRSEYDLNRRVTRFF